MTAHRHIDKWQMAHGFYIGQKVGLAPDVRSFPVLRRLLAQQAAVVLAICQCESIKVRRPNERNPKKTIAEWWAADLWRPAARGRAA